MGAFRLRPTHVWDTPDWDLILRVFTDLAYVESSHALDSEDPDTLASVGGGVELQILRNFDVRVDVGHTLHDLSAIGGQSGETRAHVAATLLY